MAKDTFGSSLMEECGHKCSRLPLNVVSVNGCQDVKPKVITALNGALDSARVPHPGVWLINTGGSGREGRTGAERADPVGHRWTTSARCDSPEKARSCRRASVLTAG